MLLSRNRDPGVASELWQRVGPAWRALGAAALTLLMACDPGWFYRVPGGTAEQGADGPWYVVAGPGDTRLRIHARVFSLGFHASLEVTNLSAATPLTVRPALFEARDSRGTRLSLSDTSAYVWCRGEFGTGAVALEEGESCLVRGAFTVTPDPEVLQRVTLSFPGLTRGAAALPLQLALERIVGSVR